MTFLKLGNKDALQWCLPSRFLNLTFNALSSVLSTVPDLFHAVNKTYASGKSRRQETLEERVSYSTITVEIPILYLPVSTSDAVSNANQMRKSNISMWLQISAQFSKSDMTPNSWSKRIRI